jgi:type II secretory pathway pseudopilin PulG
MHDDERGISLVEVLIAMGLLVMASTAATRLFVMAVRQVSVTGVSVSAHALAQERIEQLASLAWHVRDDGTSVSDETTSLAEQPPTSGGSGLLPSPGRTLEANVPGYVDFLDVEGRWVGTGVRAPGSAVFVRRWAVARFAADPANTLVIQVRVLPLAAEPRDTASRQTGEALLTTALTRVRQ